MPTPKPVTLADLVRDIKTAIQNAQQQTPDILITKAECSLKATLSGGPKGGLTLGPVQIGGKYVRSQIQTLSLTLTPVPRVAELMSPASDALTKGIAAISAAANEAASSEPRFGLNEATVEINFGIDASGSVTVFVGGEVGEQNVHTLKLTLARPVQ
jgi:hypothetical protein